MPRNIKPPEAPQEEDASRYYDLHTDAVERLVTATAENSPAVPEEELKKYRRDFLSKVPSWILILFGKWWFPGMVCYFVVWGLGSLFADTLDMYVVLSLILGVVTDVLLENIIRYFSKSEETYRKWLLFPKKGFYTLFCNIPYAFLLTLCVMSVYRIINGGLAASGGYLGVEPNLFGLFYMGFDVLVVSLRNLFKKILQDALKKENKGK